LTELLIVEVLVLKITISNVASEKPKHDSSVIFLEFKLISRFPISTVCPRKTLTLRFS